MSYTGSGPGGSAQGTQSTSGFDRRAQGPSSSSGDDGPGGCLFGCLGILAALVVVPVLLFGLFTVIGVLAGGMAGH